MHAQNQETTIVSLQKNITHGLKELIGRGEIRGNRLNADFLKLCSMEYTKARFSCA
jgi:hypothetical protein